MISMTDDYIYAEPDEKTVFVDRKGKHWDSREEAIASNVFQDVKDFIKDADGTHSNHVNFADDLLKIAKQKPQMLRDFLECFE